MAGHERRFLPGFTHARASVDMAPAHNTIRCAQPSGTIRIPHLFDKHVIVTYLFTHRSVVSEPQPANWASRKGKPIVRSGRKAMGLRGRSPGCRKVGLRVQFPKEIALCARFLPSGLADVAWMPLVLAFGTHLSAYIFLILSAVHRFGQLVSQI